MLMCELQGQTINKAAENRRLLPHLRGRTKAAIEFKHCNISAALVEIGIPHIAGYKPRRNFQRQALFTALEQQLNRLSGLDAAAISSVERPASCPEGLDYARVVASTPHLPHEPLEDSPRVAKRDYLAIEARNRALGLAGEHFVLAFEKWQLSTHGHHELARQVEHVSEIRGDGADYDILSYDPDGRVRYVEVKTTSYAAETPFYISANEVRFAEDNDDSYRLTRVFDFRRTPRLFMLEGAPTRHCTLDPANFRATLS